MTTLFDAPPPGRLAPYHPAVKLYPQLREQVNRYIRDDYADALCFADDEEFIDWCYRCMACVHLCRAISPKLYAFCVV